MAGPFLLPPLPCEALAGDRSLAQEHADLAPLDRIYVGEGDIGVGRCPWRQRRRRGGRAPAGGRGGAQAETTCLCPHACCLAGAAAGPGQPTCSGPRLADAVPQRPDPVPSALDLRAQGRLTGLSAAAARRRSLPRKVSRWLWRWPVRHTTAVGGREAGGGALDLAPRPHPVPPGQGAAPVVGHAPDGGWRRSAASTAGACAGDGSWRRLRRAVG